jgi:hypothetical protein
MPALPSCSMHAQINDVTDGLDRVGPGARLACAAHACWAHACVLSHLPHHSSSAGTLTRLLTRPACPTQLRFDEAYDDDDPAQPVPVAEHACSYCGVQNPACVVKCLGTGKWFCNGKVNRSGSCIILHLVRRARGGSLLLGQAGKGGLLDPYVVAVLSTIRKQKGPWCMGGKEVRREVVA